MKEMKNIIITGGAGFIGSTLIKEFLKNYNNYNIINVDKLTYAANLNSLSEVEKNKRYFFEQADICDKKSIDFLLQKYKPNSIMNLAAESHVDKSIEDPKEFINTNIIGTFTLLESSRLFYKKLSHKERKKFRFHHISTDEVYGDLEDSSSFFTETTSYSPSSPYSSSKASSDHLVRAWGRTYKLPVIITNCSNNYGPFHFPEKLIPHTILKALHGKPLPIYGNGTQVRDWLYVEDHAKALIKVLKNGKTGETYNIGGFNQKTNLEVVESICDILEEFKIKKPKTINSFRDLITFVEDRPGHDTRYAIDASKISKELDWYPNETFESGLRKTVKWYIDNESWWQEIFSRNYRLQRQGSPRNE